MKQNVLRYKVVRVERCEPVGEPISYVLDIEEAMSMARRLAAGTTGQYGVLVCNRTTKAEALFYIVS